MPPIKPTYQPARYFTWTLLLTFTLLLAAVAVSRIDSNGLFVALLVPATMTPFLVSLVMILRSKERGLRKDFADRLINLRRVQPAMLPVLLLTGPLLVLVSILLTLPFGGSPEQFQFSQDFLFSAQMLPSLLLLLVIATFEELGWRGYAFDSLLSRFNFFQSALLFGALWSLWHLPLLLVNGTYQHEIFVENAWFGVNFLVSVIPMGLIISWVWIKNRKSIPAAVLFHFLINVSQEALNMPQTTKCIETGVVFAFAAAIVLLDRKLFFGRQPETLPALVKRPSAA